MVSGRSEERLGPMEFCHISGLNAFTCVMVDHSPFLNALFISLLRYPLSSVLARWLIVAQAGLSRGLTATYLDTLSLGAYTE